MPVHDDGLDEMVADLREQAPAGGYDRALEVRNVAEHAEPVQDLEGHFVIDEDHLVETVERHAESLVDSGLPLTRENLDRALDAAGFEEVDYLRSLTGQTTDDGRERHPGHWADRSGMLSSSYHHQVIT